VKSVLTANLARMLAPAPSPKQITSLILCKQQQQQQLIDSLFQPTVSKQQQQTNKSAP